MKKHLLFLSLLLVGCNNTSSVSSIVSSIVSSNIISSESISSSEEVSSSSLENSSSALSSFSSEEVSSISSSEISSEEESSISEENNVTLNSLSEIKTYAEGYNFEVNEYGVGNSEAKVKIKGTLLAAIDMVLSKSGAGNRYKLLFVNNDGYIFCSVPFEFYDIAKASIGKSYAIEGTLSIYCSRYEINCNNDSFKEVNESYEYHHLFEEATLSTVYEIAAKMDLNTKGCNADKLVKLKMKYLAKMDDAVALFFDGEKIVQVHGSSKFQNNLTINKYYEISGFVNMFNFKPGIEYCSSKEIDDLNFEINKENLTYIDENIYKTYYEVDKNKDCSSYTSMFSSLYIFKGYANYYTKNSSYYTVLDHQYKENYYSSYTSASAAKALFVKNESAANLYSDRDFSYNIFHQPCIESLEFEVIVAPYLWNTNKYWQVYALEDSLSLMI